MSKTDMTVANTIAAQIGQRAFFMMGAQNIAGTADSLSFKVRGSKNWSHVKVTLMPSDTYKVSFYKFRGVNIVAVKDVEMVYADSLLSVISNSTGLAVTL